MQRLAGRRSCASPSLASASFGSSARSLESGASPYLGALRRGARRGRKAAGDAAAFGSAADRRAGHPAVCQAIRIVRAAAHVLRDDLHLGRAATAAYGVYRGPTVIALLQKIPVPQAAKFDRATPKFVMPR